VRAATTAAAAATTAAATTAAAIAAATTTAAAATAAGTAAAATAAAPLAAAFARVADHDGYTPLHAAVIGRAPECAALLVEHGFDCNATNRYLQTPLHLAARLGAYDSAQLLLGYGADPLRRDERSQQACLTLTLTLTPTLALTQTSRHAMRCDAMRCVAVVWCSMQCTVYFPRTVHDVMHRCGALLVGSIAHTVH
jgi:hypothetical protein